MFLRSINILTFTFCLALQSFAQDSAIYVWQKVLSIPVDSASQWSMDNLEYHYAVKDDAIVKLDSAGKLKFSQSIKSLGAMSDMRAVNTMKLLHFSEEQQTICFFDNTLTQTDDCIDLGELEFGNVINVSASAQPDKIWVFDQVNSSLHLVPMHGTGHGQEVVNLQGLLGLEEIWKMIEVGGNLYVMEPEEKVFVLDIYGTLYNQFETPGVVDMCVVEDRLYTISDNGDLTTFNVNTLESATVALPLDDVFEFQWYDNYFFFRDVECVHKFSLQIPN